MLERLTLARDLLDCTGAVLAPAGAVLSVTVVRATASRTSPALARPLADTFAAADLRLPLAAPVYRHLFRGASQDAVARALLACELPDALWEELRAMRATDPARYWHALATGAIAARMLLAALGEASSIARMAGAGLLHDLGMRHVSPHLARNGDLLSADEREEVAGHPVLGGYHLALLLGDHPAVEAALATAITCTDRGAADVLIADAAAGRADPDAVRLLVHALRNGKGDLCTLRFGRERIGHAPAVNRHTPIHVAIA